MNKYSFLVIILCSLALGTYAQSAKITIADNSAKVEMTMSMDKAISTVVNNTVIARADSELLVVGDNYSTLYTVEYNNSVYTLNELVDDEVNETFSSTRVSDIRDRLILWIKEVQD